MDRQILILDSTESGHTLLADIVKLTEVAFSRICLLGEGNLFQSNCLSKDLVDHRRKDGYDN